MSGRCFRPWLWFSATLAILLVTAFSSGSLRAQDPPPTDEAEAPAKAPADDPQPARESGGGVKSASGEPAGPEPPYIKAVETKHWRPVSPLPEKFDWIQLTSDEWLKGEFIALYDENLEFDSDELDLLELDWSDVKQVRTAQIMDVALLHDVEATGRLWIEGQTVRVIGDEGVREFSRWQIVTITSGAPSEWKRWSGKVTVGANIQQGNTDQVEINTRMNFKRRTIENRLVMDYTKNFTTSSGIDTVNNERAGVNWDKFITTRFFVNPTIFDWYRDPFVNISSRTTFGVGAGYQIVDTKRTEWDVSGGPGYQETHFDSVQAGEPDQTSTGALTIETNFDQDWTKDIEFIYIYRAQFTNTASGKYNHHMEMRLETEWTSVLDFDLAFVWDRTERPQPDENGVVPEQDDYRMYVGLGIEF